MYTQHPNWTFLLPYLSDSEGGLADMNLKSLLQYPVLDKQFRDLIYKYSNLNANYNNINSEQKHIRDKYAAIAKNLKEKGMYLRKILKAPQPWRIFSITKVTEPYTFKKLKEKIPNYKPRTLDIIAVSDTGAYLMVIGDKLIPVDISTVAETITNITGMKL